jgi:hypothetical protein
LEEGFRDIMEVTSRHLTGEKGKKYKISPSVYGVPGDRDSNPALLE